MNLKIFCSPFSCLDQNCHVISLKYFPKFSEVFQNFLMICTQNGLAKLLVDIIAISSPSFDLMTLVLKSVNAFSDTTSLI